MRSVIHCWRFKFVENSTNLKRQQCIMERIVAFEPEHISLLLHVSDGQRVDPSRRRGLQGDTVDGLLPLALACIT